MADIVNTPDDPIDVGTEIVSGSKNIDMVVRRQYVPPLDGNGDDYAAIDQQTARYVAEILVKTYFGYPWHVTASVKQGVVMFRIPPLMGATLQYVINLAKFSDLTRDLIMRCGGELLERMNLPRGAIDMALMQEARRNLHKFDFADVGARK